MSYKKPETKRLRYTIGEVADMFSFNVSKIRYWTNTFDILKPVTNKKGNRLFTEEEIEKIRLIYYLLEEKGLTIDGAKKKIKENRADLEYNYEIVKKLQTIKSELKQIRESLDN